MAKYVSPTRNLAAFTCPSCTTFAQQLWSWRMGHFPYQNGQLEMVPLSRCRCTSCNYVSFWSNDLEVQIHPKAVAAPMPHPDMPDDAAFDYQEARRVAADSPRAAAALLRLSVQKLLAKIGGSGESIDKDIALLVTKGMPSQVTDALDICRVVGNNAVHPGELNVQDDPALVAQLFELINFIVAQTVEREKNLAAMMAKLPQGAKDAIARRDAKAIAAASPVPPAAP